MRLVVTIDTEEDQWGGSSHDGFSFKNIERIPSLQCLFDKYDVIPTYLITYPVAKDENSVKILRRIFDDGKCEIGTHPHSWNTPPYNKEKNPLYHMLHNLPPEVQSKKISSLHDVIFKQFGVEPKLFRSGKWGVDMGLLKVIENLGYEVDTSITPYTDWTFNDGPDLSKFSPKPYWVGGDHNNGGNHGNGLLEVPATIGYLQRNYQFCSKMDAVMDNLIFNKLRVKGILSILRLFNKVWLSPEQSDDKSMISLTRRLKKKDYRVINMFFHSQSLIPGLSPFVNKGVSVWFLKRIEDFLSYTKEDGIKPIKLSRLPEII